MVALQGSIKFLFYTQASTHGVTDLIVEQNQGLCLGLCFGMKLEVWGSIPGKKKLSSDSKYDVKLKGNNSYSKESKRTREELTALA